MTRHTSAGHAAVRLHEQHILASLAEHAARRPDAVAYDFYRSFDLADHAGALTYRELMLSAQSIGAHLTSRVEAGDRVALMFPAGLEFIQALLGVFVAKATAIPTPTPGGFSAHDERLVSIVRDSQPILLLTTDAHYADAQRSMRALGDRAPRVVSFTTLTSMRPGGIARELHPSDVAFLQYTSGSTGDPKGVEVTHENLWANVSLIQESLQGGSTTPVIGWLPHIHDMGLVGHLLWSLHAGAPCTIVPPTEFAKRPAKWIEMISVGKYAGTAAPNSAYEIAARVYPRQKLEELDLSSWRIALNGAEPVSASTLRRFETVFGPAGFDPSSFVPAYGLAEATLFVTCSLPGQEVSTLRVAPERLWLGDAQASSSPDAIELVSSGSVSNRGVSIRDADGIVLPDGRVGRIFVEGAHVTRRYRASASTREELDTGDLGFIQGNELYVTGRAKDLIILNGRNIAPHDVEQAVAQIVPLARLDGVAAHQPTSTGDDRVHIFVELRPDQADAALLGKIEAAVQTQLLAQFALSRTTLVPVRPGKVPRTTSGKVQRARAYDMYRAGRLQSLASLEQSHKIA